jgi:hypothetical protein
MQAVGHGFVEALLHVNGAAAVQSNLQKNAVVRSMDSEVIPVELQAIFGMLGDDLEAVVFGDIQHIHHRLVDDLTNLCAVFRRPALQQVDSD